MLEAGGGHRVVREEKFVLVLCLGSFYDRSAIRPVRDWGVRLDREAV
jgi:hypothetical protein